MPHKPRQLVLAVRLLGHGLTATGALATVLIALLPGPRHGLTTRPATERYAAQSTDAHREHATRRAGRSSCAPTPGPPRRLRTPPTEPGAPPSWRSRSLEAQQLHRSLRTPLEVVTSPMHPTVILNLSTGRSKQIDQLLPTERVPLLRMRQRVHGTDCCSHRGWSPASTHRMNASS
jgi:hypothetical protein